MRATVWMRVVMVAIAASAVGCGGYVEPEGDEDVVADEGDDPGEAEVGEDEGAIQYCPEWPCEPIEQPPPPPKPDLKPVPYWSSFCSLDTYDGLQLKVTNAGTANAPASTYWVKSNYWSGPGLTYSVPALAPGASHTFSLPFVHYDVGCSYWGCEFEVRADYGSAVSESSETNNYKKFPCNAY